MLRQNSKPDTRQSGRMVEFGSRSKENRRAWAKLGLELYAVVSLVIMLGNGDMVVPEPNYGVYVYYIYICLAQRGDGVLSNEGHVCH